MPNAIVSATAGAVLGGSLVAVLLWPGEAPAPIAAPPTTAATSSPTTVASASPAIDLAPVTSRLDELTRRVDALATKVEAVLAMPARTEVRAEPSATAKVDADALQEAMAEIQRRKLAAMSDDALRQAAWQAVKSGAGDDAQIAFDLLLARAGTPEKRAQALTEIAMLQRTRGSEQDLAASAKSLQTVIDENGFDSEPGLTAAYQAVWTASARKDYATGLRHAEAIASSGKATADTRVNARWAAAIMRQSLGDTGRARSDYEQLLRELEGQQRHTKLVDDIRNRLAQMAR